MTAPLNAVYPKALTAFESGTIDLTTATIKAQMVTVAYVYSSAHQFASSLAGLIGTAVTLTGKAVTSGLFTATVPTFSSVAAGDTVTAVVIYKDTGSAATSPLLAYIARRADSIPISIVTNGGNITLTPSANRIFSI